MRTKPHRPAALRRLNSRLLARFLPWLFRCMTRRLAPRSCPWLNPLACASCLQSSWIFWSPLTQTPFLASSPPPPPPANIILVRHRNPSGGCDSEVPTQFPCDGLQARVARWLRLPMRALEKYPCGGAFGASPNMASLLPRRQRWIFLLSCPILSFLYQSSCAFWYSYTGTILWSTSYVAFPYFPYNFGFSSSSHHRLFMPPSLVLPKRIINYSRFKLNWIGRFYCNWISLDICIHYIL